MLSDFRLSLRTLAKSPFFVVVAIFTLALGIGVNTAMFSIVEGIALRGLLVPEQQRVVFIGTHQADNADDRARLSWAEFEEWRDRQQTCLEVTAYEDNTATVSGPGADPAVIGTTLKINGEWSTVVGVAPADFRFPEHAGLFFPIRDLHRADKRDNRILAVLGRLKPGATVAQAQVELAAITGRFATDHPDTTKGIVYQAQKMRDAFVDPETRQLLGLT
ncbi:MAG: hypothetical protein EXS42_01635 [Lacunisphaera sp.]|nr:hypothetical protein [Lacunisphaera sp.]